MPLIGNLTTDALLIALSGIVIVFLMLAVLSGIVVVISRVVGALAGASAKPAPAANAKPVPAAAPAVNAAQPITPIVASTAQSAPYGGTVALSGVDDLTAACIMAIVSDETGVAVNELVFKSIKAI